MSTEGFLDIIRAEPAARADLFLAAAQRMGVPLVNVEKDFWVCWTLNVLYHRLPPGGPRLLFKGGSSLSKAYGLINRFSEDIDLTVFRDDLGHPASAEEFASLSNRKRRATLEAIAEDCRAYITGDLLAGVSKFLNADTSGLGRVEIDEADASGQTLLVWYPRIDRSDPGYVQAAVKIESGAKSASDPNQPISIRPYIADDVQSLGLSVAGITSIKAERTFWDKIVIAHGLRNWFERRGELRQEGQRISRHYYDLHCLMGTAVGIDAAANRDLGADCVAHAETFFSRPDYNLRTATPGSFTLKPVGEMVDRLESDYANMTAMIFGDAPSFKEIIRSVEQLESVLEANPKLYV